MPRVPSIQRWHMTPGDLERPEGQLRLTNDLAKQVANAISVLPVRVVREFSLTAPATWLTLDLLNSWVDVPGFDALAAWKDANGIVHLRGAAKGGTYGALPVATLPANLRPASTVSLLTVQSNATYTPLGVVSILSTGDILAASVTSVQVGTSTFLGFEGLSFVAGDSTPDYTSPVLLSQLGLATQATGLQVLACYDLTLGGAPAAPVVAWAPTGRDGVKITRILGLTPGHRYSFRVEITTG